MNYKYLDVGLSKNPRHHHVRVLDVAVLLGALALIVIGILFLIKNKSEKLVSSSSSHMTAEEFKRDILLNSVNPTLNLSAEEVAEKKVLLNEANPTYKMTQEEIKKKQTILMNL